MKNAKTRKCTSSVCLKNHDSFSRHIEPIVATERAAKPTPTPWKYRMGTVYEGTKAGFRFETTVANCQGSTQEEMLANAAFIVRAVNAYDALVAERASLSSINEELLKQLKSIHRHYQGKDMVNGEHTYVCGACLAIAKAEKSHTPQRGEESTKGE